MSTRQHHIATRPDVAQRHRRVWGAPYYDVRTDDWPPLSLPDLWRVVDAPVGEVRIVAEPGRLTVILPTAAPAVPASTRVRDFRREELWAAAGAVAIG